MLSQALCLDANVFISSMVPEEPCHENALSLLTWIQYNEVSLYEPALVLFEVVSTLHRKVFLGELDRYHFERGRDLFFELPLLLQWRPHLLKRAAEIAASLSFKNIYDAAYLAVAQAKKIPLITSDEELARKGKKVYPRLLTVDGFLKAREI